MPLYFPTPLTDLLSSGRILHALDERSPEEILGYDEHGLPT
jgi:hypothetical protein